jgi:c-di-GMP phosphodiesterase Gmr
MQSPAKYDLQTAATAADGALAVDTELSILRGVFRMLPAGVTVQDEQGRFLLVNDVAAEQLGIVVDGPAAPG